LNCGEANVDIVGIDTFKVLHGATYAAVADVNFLIE
jgi:hypothetical protein